MRLVRSGWALVAALALMSLGISFLFGGPRSLVAWDGIRAVAIESDDWGLAGFVPEADSWAGLDRHQLDTGRFPEVYWLSTLEDGAMVKNLSQVLARYPGMGGHPAVLQPNYIMSSLEYSSGEWVSHDLPEFPDAYHRPGLWDAVQEAIGAGTWYPELHGKWHYDPEMRKHQALESPLAEKVTDRGIMLFPGSERARELGDWRSMPDLERELDHSLAVFADLFGRPVGSVIAPDYNWSSRVERMWASRGIRVIQGKREQINPAWGSGKPARVRKFLQRRWDMWRHPARTYLERNCRLEPVQAPDPQVVVDDCTVATRGAWAKRQPAIVESHRVNFAHLDPDLVAKGLESLESYLSDITSEAEKLPTFMTGREISQLSARGTSWCVLGGKIVVRNATKARRVVAIPPQALALAAQQGGLPGNEFQSILVAVPSATTIDLVP